MAITVTLTRQPMKDGTTRLKLLSPYSPDVPAACRAIGGKWNATVKAWLFDERDANRVRDLCLKHWGIDPLADPDEAPELVTVRLLVDAYNPADSLWVFGRELASQPSRDGRPRLGNGVIIIGGAFKGGGSRANPALMPQDGTVLEVRDVPKPLVDEELARWRESHEGSIRLEEKVRTEVADLEARIAAGPTDADRATQFMGKLADGTLGYLDPEAAGAHVMASLVIKLADTRARLARQEAWTVTLRDAVRVVEAAPDVTPVNPATAQIGALFTSLAPDGRRAIIMSMIASMSSAERPALIRELQQYLDQGAI